MQKCQKWSKIEETEVKIVMLVREDQQETV